LNQTLTTTVICVTGASLAGLAAIIYHNRERIPESGLPVKFTNTNITQRFVASLPELTQELNLELGTARQVETFTQTEECRTLWGLIDLGTNTAQISVPVTYRYHVQLRDTWKLETQDDRVIVHAPALRAAVPPAIHTDEMQRLGLRGWARFAPTDLLQELELRITPTLTRFAQDPRRLNLVRDTCRRSAAEFVRLWLERERQWGRAGFTQIQVKFADEPALPQAPTLKFLS